MTHRAPDTATTMATGQPAVEGATAAAVGSVEVYLDHSASAPLAPVAAAAVGAWLARHGGGNPSSQHVHGQRARAALDGARACLADALGLDVDGWIFCSGATEANALALRGAADAWRRVGRPLGTIGVAAIEHPSLLHPAETLEAIGWRRVDLPVGPDGVIDVASTIAALRGQPRPWLIAVAAVHHELGAIQPVAALAAALGHAAAAGAADATSPAVAPGRGRRRPAVADAAAPRHEVPELHLHVDGSQAVGRVDASGWAAEATTVVVSAHKFGGLPGSGALWLRPGRWVDAQLRGGQERGLRGGTENVIGAIAMGAAATGIADRLAAAAALRVLRDRLWTELQVRWPGVQRHGPTSGGAETGHVLSVAFPGVAADVLVAALDLEGIAVSAGAACSSGTAQPSPAIARLAGAEIARRTLRFSLGPGVDEAAISRTVAVLASVRQRLLLLAEGP